VKVTIDNLDGAGAVDYSAALCADGPLKIERALNAPSLCSGMLDVSDAALVVVMAGAQDPGNVGTIARSAEAFGATGVVTTRGSADPWSPKALRASAGSGLRVPVLRGMAIPVLLAQLRVAGVKIVAASSHAAAADAGGADDAVADLREAVAIFIGNEGAGLPREIENVADARISIPMSAGVESLNAGVAASVVLYEAARQRKSFTTDEH